MVSFIGDKGFMYKCNLALMRAIKILKPIASFKVLMKQIYMIKFIKLNGKIM